MEQLRIRNVGSIGSHLVVALAACLVFPLSALANGVPMPVDPGEVYLEASAGYGKLRSDPSRLLRTYVNDQEAAGENITLANNQGFLAQFDTTSDGWHLIPALKLGFATKKPWFGGALGGVTRLEISGDYYQRSARYSIDTLAIPQSGYTVDVGGTPEDRGLVVHFGRIDGTSFDDDNSATSGSLTGYNVEPLLVVESVGQDPSAPDPNDSITLELSERTGNGQMMVFFDQQKGPWVFSRGVGANVGYTKARYQYAVPLREDTSVFPDYADPVTGVNRQDYEFELGSTTVGANAAFSLGFRPIKYFTLFWNGSFMPGFSVTRIEGRQYGFCLEENVGCDSFDYNIVELDARDVNFVYDARSAAGASLLLYRFIRVSAQVGIFANNQSPQPYERNDGGRFETRMAKLWGYYGRASVMLSF